MYDPLGDTIVVEVDSGREVVDGSRLLTHQLVERGSKRRRRDGGGSLRARKTREKGDDSQCEARHFTGKNASAEPSIPGGSSEINQPKSDGATHARICYELDVNTQPGLRRSLGFWALVVYGVGDILGAGIYALVGKVAGMAGHASWISFLMALVVATFTALTYAELGGRFPKSAGESWFAEQAFGSKRFALGVGWVVLCSGVLSLATMSLAFAGYLTGMVPGVPSFFVVVAILALLAFINFRGLRESSAANILATTIELAGLLIVVVVGAVFLARTGTADPAQLAAPAPPPTWCSIAQGGALAFFAFIGFEDMIKVAEEVEDPERNMPRAILLSLLITGVGYLIVVVIATRVVEPSALARSDAPLLTVVERAEPRIPHSLFGLIALFAVANTALLNFVMGSRLLYGMARQGPLPSWLGTVHRTRRTPHWGHPDDPRRGPRPGVVRNADLSRRNHQPSLAPRLLHAPRVPHRRQATERPTAIRVSRSGRRSDCRRDLLRCPDSFRPARVDGHRSDHCRARGGVGRRTRAIHGLGEGASMSSSRWMRSAGSSARPRRL